jgi:hypothetical protein
MISLAQLGGISNTLDVREVLLPICTLYLLYLILSPLLYVCSLPKQGIKVEWAPRHLVKNHLADIHLTMNH